MVAENGLSNGVDGNILEEQADLYDRQIRLWGVDTQKRLQTAKVLMVGCSGLGAEVAKNLVLAGVGTLDIMDDRPVSQAEPSNFLVDSASSSQTVAEASVAMLHEMNQHVALGIRRGDVGDMAEPADLVRGYNVVLATGQKLVELLRLDKACEEEDAGFFVGVSRGTTAFMFANLHKHRYTCLVPSADGTCTTTEEGCIEYARLSRALFHPWAGFPPRTTHPLFYAVRVCGLYERVHEKFPEPSDFQVVQQMGSHMAQEEGVCQQVKTHLPEDDLYEYIAGTEEYPAVNSVLGGFLGNEIIKAISKRDKPVNNFLFFSMRDSSAVLETLGEPNVPNRNS